MEVDTKKLAFALVAIVWFSVMLWAGTGKAAQLRPRMTSFVLLGAALGWSIPMLTAGEFNLFSVFCGFTGFLLGMIYAGMTYKGRD